MHILTLDYPISAYDHFSESLRGVDIDFEVVTFIGTMVQSNISKTRKIAQFYEPANISTQINC